MFYTQDSDLNAEDDFGETIFMKLESEITDTSNSQEEIEIFQNLLKFFQEEDKNNVGGKKDAVWIEEPMVQAIRNNNFKYFIILVILGGQLGDYGFEYFVNKIENESEKFAEKRYLIMFLSKIRDEYGQTLLHYAAWKGKLNCLKILIGYKLNVDKRKTDAEQTSSLFTWKNRENRCNKTLFENNVSVNVYNLKRQTPIHLAACEGNLECLELLINKGADVNAKDEINLTPLHHASEFGEVNCLEVLLANGADVNANDKNNSTPLHRASECGKVNCLEVLLANGADVNAKDETNLTPLHLSAWYGKFDCLEVLLANEANVNARTNKLNTPLHILGISPEGSKEEKERCAKILLDAGVDIDAKDKDGNTIIYYQFFQTLRVERPDLFIQKTKRKFI